MITKRAKATAIRGLKANWKMAAGLTAPKAKATGTTSRRKSSPEAQDEDDLKGNLLKMKATLC